MTTPTKLLFPNVSHRARRQMEEWKWVLWFLTIGWWYLPVVGVTWVCWTLAKIVILGTAWFIQRIKEVIDEHRS